MVEACPIVILDGGSVIHPGAHVCEVPICDIKSKLVIAIEFIYKADDEI